MTESLLPIIAVIVPVYWLWRRGVATDARIKILDEVDSFLNPEKNNSEMAKEIVYNAYEDSKNNFFVLEILHFILFRVDAKRFGDSRKEFDKIPDAERKKMVQIVGKLMMSNIKLSPITYLFVGVIFMLFAFFMTLINHLSPNKIKRSLQCWKEKLLYSLYSF